MRASMLRGLSVIGVVVVVVSLAALWLLRSSPSDIIPAEFRGIWLDQGAECDDANAQARITGSTVNYDRLSFKADGVTEKSGDTVSLTGQSFPAGTAQRATVQLSLQDRRNTLVIVARDLRGQRSFVRCGPNDEK